MGDRYPIDGGSMGYHTVSDTVSESDTETESENISETESEPGNLIDINKEFFRLFLYHITFSF